MNELPMTQKIRLNLSIQGRRTSVALEAGVWDCLTEICRREELSLDELCDEIIGQSEDISMASAIRICALEYFRKLHDKRSDTRSAA
jgi:predicted DNA-binding ribbon-helix-helix protein